MNRRLVNVYLRQGEYIISTHSRTKAGFWVLDGTPSRMRQASAPSELGAAILTALEKCREGLEAPGRDGTPSRPLLDLLGLTDYVAFLKGTRSVEVYIDASGTQEKVEITPQRNEGGRHGFTPVDEATSVFPYDSPEQLGNEVIEAFDKTG